MVLSLNIQTPMSRREDEGGWSESRSHIAHLSAHLRRPNLPLLVRAASQLRWTCLTASSPQRKGPMLDEGNGSNTCSHATPSCHIQLGSRDRARLPSVHWHRAADLAAALAPQQRPGPPLFVSTISVSLCTSLTHALACAQVFELQGLQPRAGHARAEARQQELDGNGKRRSFNVKVKTRSPLRVTRTERLSSSAQGDATELQRCLMDGVTELWSVEKGQISSDRLPEAVPGHISTGMFHSAAERGSAGLTCEWVSVDTLFTRNLHFNVSYRQLAFSLEYQIFLA